MGLQDLLAVVLGVKTAEALEQRRRAEADRAQMLDMFRQRDAELDEFMAELEREEGAAPPTATSPAASAWAPSHRVPAQGMAAWAAPDPSLPPAHGLNGHLELMVSEKAGDWARVVAVNGWTGWVDGRLLVPAMPPPPPAAFSISSSEMAAVQFQVTYARIEDVINDDLGRALGSGVAPEEAMANWASSAGPKLREYRVTMDECRLWNLEADTMFELIDAALESYLAATTALLEHRPNGGDLLARAADEWRDVQWLVEQLTGS